MKWLSSFLLFIYSGKEAVKGQAFRSPVYTAIPTYSIQQADAFSFASNQAALASLHQFSAGVYAERIFFLRDLTHYRAAVAVVTTSGNFGFTGAYFGNPNYAETTCGLSYARSLGKIDIGA